MTKFVFVTGGVLSSLGKGVVASSLAKLLDSRGMNVANMKIDPYLNCDAGTLNPFEHGEVFVTRDGFECDLDLGNYERFLNVYAKKQQNLMMGSVYQSVIENERRGEYIGKTIQLIPHVSNEIKHRIRLAAKATECDLLVVEVGGTVGDIESEVVFEAIRQFRLEMPAEDSFIAHVALVPTILTGEEKTKPLQHSVKALLSRGLVPDAVIARAPRMVSAQARDKISLFCSVPKEAVFTSPDTDNVYSIPMLFEKQGLDEVLAAKMRFKLGKADLKEWGELVQKMGSGRKQRRVAVIGKYASMKDTYASVFEALKHAAAHNDVKLDAVLVDSEKLEGGKESLEGFDGFIVPGGFGSRGIEGIISAIRLAREKDVPFLGLCYGLQLAVIEFSRNVAGWKKANSTEIDAETPYPVICILPEKKGLEELGGTLRLGAHDVKLFKGTKAFECYKSETISKRFRHRFEVNPELVAALEEKGLVFSGRDPKREIMKVIELPDKRFFVAVQFHPEFDSRLEEPEPLFNGFVKAVAEK